MNSKRNTSRKLTPGKPGTKKLIEQYGENLLCVRYRYDGENKIKYKTAEIIVERGFWDPGSEKLKEEKHVEIKVGYNEMELRAKVKAGGGRWNPGRKVWEISYRAAKELGLAERIIKHG